MRNKSSEPSVVSTPAVKIACEPDGLRGGESTFCLKHRIEAVATPIQDIESRDLDTSTD